MNDGHFTGYGKVHPTTGDSAHDVRVAHGAGQVILICFTCETYQTVDTIDAGLEIKKKAVRGE